MKKNKPLSIESRNFDINQNLFFISQNLIKFIICTNMNNKYIYFEQIIIFKNQYVSLEY